MITALCLVVHLVGKARLVVAHRALDGIVDCRLAVDEVERQTIRRVSGLLEETDDHGRHVFPLDSPLSPEASGLLSAYIGQMAKEKRQQDSR